VAVISTAGPQTGTGPRRFFAGPQNNLDFPSNVFVDFPSSD